METSSKFLLFKREFQYEFSSDERIKSKKEIFFFIILYHETDFLKGFLGGDSSEDKERELVLEMLKEFKKSENIV